MCCPPTLIQIERGDAHVGFPDPCHVADAPRDSAGGGVVFSPFQFNGPASSHFNYFVNQEWHDLMPRSPPPRPTLSQQRLRQCVAGASAMSVGRGAVFVFRDSVSLGEGKWSSVRGNGDGSGGWNVGESGCEESERGERGGECFEEEQGGGGGDDCGGFGRGVARWRQWLRVVVRAMWNASTVSLWMRTREQEEADPWRSFIVDLIENCPSSAACSLVRTGISCGGFAKVISNVDHQNMSDLIIECNVIDLCWLGNDVTVSCSSAILKYTNAGRELQRKAMEKEALADADSLQQNIRRPFILIQIGESRVGQDRRVSLYDPKFDSATIKKQVFDAQSLRLLEGYSATSSQPYVLQHWRPYLYQVFDDSSFQSFMVLGWRSIWTLWHYFLLQLMKSVVLFQFR